MVAELFKKKKKGCNHCILIVQKKKKMMVIKKLDGQHGGNQEKECQNAAHIMPY